MPTSVLILTGSILAIVFIVHITSKSSKQHAQLREEHLRIARQISKEITRDSLTNVLEHSRWMDCIIREDHGRWRVIRVDIPEDRAPNWPSFVHDIARQQPPSGAGRQAEAIRATADLVLELMYKCR
jgi:hypothetical protein